MKTPESLQFKVDDKWICPCCFKEVLKQSEKPEVLMQITEWEPIQGDLICPECCSPFYRQEVYEAALFIKKIMEKGNKTPITELEKVLMKRDSCTLEQARKLIQEAKDDLQTRLEDPDADPFCICGDWFGLEEDYIFDLV